jgi:hypothetical protein
LPDALMRTYVPRVDAMRGAPCPSSKRRSADGGREPLPDSAPCHPHRLPSARGATVSM